MTRGGRLLLALRFLSTLPARGATVCGSSGGMTCGYFYPRSPRGERPHGHLHPPPAGHFYPRSPRGERRFLTLLRTAEEVLISIHAPREGSDDVFPSRVRVVKRISIHAPREGSDEQLTGGVETLFKISIHAPREGSDAARPHNCRKRPRFLSTLPARGATRRRSFGGSLWLFLSTLPARGATLPTSFSMFEALAFLSTLPARGATRSERRRTPLTRISIHAPREGSDTGRMGTPSAL